MLNKTKTELESIIRGVKIIKLEIIVSVILGSG